MINILLINGACGIGKSTIATLLHQAIPGSFLRQKDEQRRMISGYNDSKENYKQSASTTFQLTKAVITGCISNNTPLIYEGLMRDCNQINELQQLVSDQGGNFYHFILHTPKDIWRKRIESRGVSGSLTVEKAELFYDDIQELIHQVEHILIDASGENKNQIVGVIKGHLSQ